jgi:glycosyltransferase 2 family protein
VRRLSRYVFPGLLTVFAVACLYGLRGDLARISLAPLAHAGDLVALAALCSLFNYALRIIRWRHYLARLGCSLPLRFTALTYIAGFAFTVSPGKLGELARARYYSGAGSPAGATLPNVAGAFFVERLMDVTAMIVLAALIVTSAPRYEFVIWSAGVSALAVLALVGILPWPSLANRLEASGMPRVFTRAAGGAARAFGAARSLLSPGVSLFGFTLAFLAWGLEGLGLCVLASIFPAAHMLPATGVGIYAIAVLAGALSFLPGGLGSTEAVMAALLTAQGYPVSDALLVTIVCRILTLWLAVCIGWVAVFMLRSRMVSMVSAWP